MTQAPKRSRPWLPDISLPDPLATKRYQTEPLHHRHAELDFEALMSCRTRLREELRWGDWPPPDFTLELNRADLRRHHDEFVRREAFAYTVLNVEASRCLGCIYLEPCDDIEGAQLAYWVIDEAIDIEASLVADTIEWIHQSWSIDKLLLPLHETNRRGLAIARQLRLAQTHVADESPLAKHRCFLSDCRARSQSDSSHSP